MDYQRIVCDGALDVLGRLLSCGQPLAHTLAKSFTDVCGLTDEEVGACFSHLFIHAGLMFEPVFFCEGLKFLVLDCIRLALLCCVVCMFCVLFIVLFSELCLSLLHVCFAKLLLADCTIRWGWCYQLHSGVFWIA